MIGMIKSIFTPKTGIVVYEDSEDARRALSELSNELETTTVMVKEDGFRKHASIITLAVRIRELLSQNALPLSHREKVEITKVLNRAKVRTFLAGTDEGFKTFRVLDAVSEDVRRYL